MAAKAYRKHSESRFRWVCWISTQAYAEAFHKFDVDESPRLSDIQCWEWIEWILNRQKMPARLTDTATVFPCKTDAISWSCNYLKCTFLLWESKTSPMSKSDWTSNMKRSDPTWCVRVLIFESVLVVLNRFVTKSSCSCVIAGDQISTPELQEVHCQHSTALLSLDHNEI